MTASRLISAWLLLIALVPCAAAAESEAPPTPQKQTVKPRSKGAAGETRRKHRVAEEEATAPALLEAEVAIEKQDYATAERLLRSVVEAHPKDYRAWFNLGFVYNATHRSTDAVDAYRNSVSAQPDIFESNLNLGLLLAAQSNPEAEAFLRAATKLKPSAKANEGLARAWISLARVLEATKPQDALAAYREAATLQPADAEPYLSAGLLFERQNDFPAAEQEFRRAAELDPKSAEAVAGLVNVYMRSKRLAEAETALRQYLQLNPAPQARVQLGRVLVAQGKNEEGLAELKAGLESSPNDVGALRELAQLSLAAKSYEQAASYYGRLAEAEPRNPEYRHGLGASLIKLGRHPEAEQQLTVAVSLKADLPEAYADLAIAAYENKNYPVTIKALDARARYQPETPKTYFLRATAYDHLRAHKEAAQNYRQFLAMANGEYPTQEWQARNRLKAIDPEVKK
ncbi:MAG: tetratricopeptide repeat protein [Acidobacteria bacterium]|nr:tetratricopeptide repeat protein [Acidobacteriota bacterium]